MLGILFSMIYHLGVNILTASVPTNKQHLILGVLLTDKKSTDLSLSPWLNSKNHSFKGNHFVALFPLIFLFFSRKARSSWILFNSLLRLDVIFVTQRQTKPFGKRGWKETKGFSVLRVNSHHHFSSVCVVQKAECTKMEILFIKIEAAYLYAHKQKVVKTHSLHSCSLFRNNAGSLF